MVELKKYETEKNKHEFQIEQLNEIVKENRNSLRNKEFESK